MSGLQRQLLFVLIAVNVAVHFGNLPFWIPASGVLFVVWRWLADFYRIPCPGRWSAFFLACLGTVGVWFEHGTIIGDPASTSLLVLMVSLKVFEIRGYRDLMVVTYLCLLLLMSKLLADQSLAMTIYLFADVIAILSLMYLYHLPERQKGLPWRRALKLVLVSAPIMVLLFTLFPRFNFHLFQRPPETQNQVGFSGQLRPGELARLAQSDQIAFRAFFRAGLTPPPSRLYWRGAVLQPTTDLNWDPPPLSRQAVNSSAGSEDVVEVMVEEKGSAWLFTLEYPNSVMMSHNRRQAELESGQGQTYHLQRPLEERETYVFTYDLVSASKTASAVEVEASTSYFAPSRRLKTLLDGWSKSRGKPADAIENIRRFITENQFSYTLTPPEIEDLDEFLFYTKRGFCEHYAGAVATLLRMLKIPARVVVGYQGASPSLMGDYMIVYQRDAHAWLEYWDSSKAAWQRLDPTAWVAAERLALGGPAFFQNTEPEGVGGFANHPLAKLLGADFIRFIVRSRLMMDQAEIFWVTFLLRYDFDYQRELLKSFGFDALSRGKLALILLVGLILSLGFVALVLRFRNQGLSSEDQLLYRALCRRLNKAGLEWAPHMGPNDLSYLAQGKFPQQAAQLAELFSTVIAYKYGNEPLDPKKAAEFRKKLRLLELTQS